MKLHPILNEPELQFHKDTSPCPRNGISRFGVFDLSRDTRRTELLLGAVGSPQGLEKFEQWLDRCKFFIDVDIDPNAKILHPNLHLPFYGFNEESGFRVRPVFGSNNQKKILPQIITSIIKEHHKSARINAAVDVYFEAAKFLDENRQVDVLVCILPDELFASISTSSGLDADPNDEGTLFTDEDAELMTEEESSDNELEHNFRRQLKALGIVNLNVPIQIVKESTLDKGKTSKQQIEATRAWNFFTALYYKMRNTIPWKLPVNPTEPPPCFVGLSFYQSRDRKSLRTSLAQVFDERGHGVILRGSEVIIDRNTEDRRPYLTGIQANELLERALEKYKFAMDHMPGRLVIHKSSRFRSDELDGFEQAASSRGIDQVDFVTIADSQFRLFRYGQYPPFRGTHFELTSSRHILYTKGSVEYFQTYPGMYVPEPIEIEIVEASQSARAICEEILALTKMNWNNTIFDGKYPITLSCGRKVGEIMRFLEAESDVAIKSHYSYYM